MAAVGESLRCPKCGKRPATDGRNRWCAECNAEYYRGYEGRRGEMAKQKGFKEGVRTTKDYLAEKFDQIGSGGYTGYEIAALIRQEPIPQPDDKDED